jgi:hypothetical protein
MNVIPDSNFEIKDSEAIENDKKWENSPKSGTEKDKAIVKNE